MQLGSSHRKSPDRDKLDRVSSAGQSLASVVDMDLKWDSGWLGTNRIGETSLKGA